MNARRGRAYLKTVWFTENRIMAGRAERHIREGTDGMHGALVILAFRKLKEL
jgi:hypothetical protein